MRASNCEHGNPWDECGECAIAAAEERGRETHIRDLRAIENALNEFESDPTMALRVVTELVGMALHNLRPVSGATSGVRRWLATLQPLVSRAILADVVQQVEAELDQAEERGRRSGVEERDREWRSAWSTAHEGGCVLWSCDCDEPKSEGNCARWRKLVALAPRAQASDGPPCAECKHERFWHQWSSKEHAFCCSPVGGDYCGCKNYIAPRDSAPDLHAIEADAYARDMGDRK